LKAVAPFLSQFVTANAYVNYICTQILPHLDSLITVMAADVPTVESDVLQALAELVQSVHPTNTAQPIDVKQCQEAVMARLIQMLPSPPLDTGDVSETPAIALRNTESALHTYHQLGKHSAVDVLPDDLKLKLHFLARCVQNETKKLREALDLAKKAKENMQTAENKERFIGLKSANNISAIIRDLAHMPPSFKANVLLSWKPPTKSVPVRGGNKKNNAAAIAAAAEPVAATSTVAKHEPVKVDENTNNGNAAVPSKRKAIEAPAGSEAVSAVKKEKPERQVKEVYAPPTGKFTGRGGSYSYNPTTYRGRGGGTFRGRGGYHRGQYSKRYNN